MWKPGLPGNMQTTRSVGNTNYFEAIATAEMDDYSWEYEESPVSQRRPRKKRRRRDTACDHCECMICCALQICTLQCPHQSTDFQFQSTKTSTRVENADVVGARNVLTSAEFRRRRIRAREEAYMLNCYRGTGCAPKATSVSKAAAAAMKVASEKAHQTAMETIANEKRFLDLVLNIQCPNGVEVKATARLDTGANTDVCSPELARTLKCNKVQWGSAGGHYVEVCGGTAHQPTGMLEVPVVVPARQLGLSRTVELDVDAVIMPIPQGTELLLGLPTLLNSGLLTAVMAGMTEQPSVSGVPDSRLEDEDPLDEWENLGRADEIGQDIVMPTIGGTDAEKAAIQIVLSKYKHVFGKPPIGGSKLRPMSIELKQDVALPRPAAARRVSPEILKEIREDTQMRIDNGWMRAAQVGDKCRFASPLVAARQPGKSKRRICGDYRAINDCCFLHTYPVKNAQEVVSQFKDAKYFGKADLSKGYLQLRLDDDAQELLAVRTPDGLYFPLTLPFGPASGPAQFQQRVSEVLGDLEGHGVASYIDDLGLYAGSFAQFLTRLETMLKRLDSYDIRLNGAKCEFNTKQLNFLGHTVSAEGVEHTKERIAAIQSMSVPTTRTQLRSFLGMCNFFRDSCPMLGPTVIALSRLSGKRGKGAFMTNEWTSEHLAAFETAKTVISNAKLLSFLDYDQPIYLRTDACNDGAGAMLYQKIGGRDRPVAFMSHTFSAAERRWSTYEQECFGIVRSILHFDSLLLGHHFIVETDHRNLVWLAASENAKVVRWRTRLQEYNFDVHHIAGVSNAVADALSRLSPTRVADEVSVSANNFSHADEKCRRGEVLDQGREALALTRRSARVCERPAGLSDELVDVIRKVHVEVAGHRRVEATMVKLLQHGHSVPHLKDYVSWVLDNCGLCQKNAALVVEASEPRFRELTEVGEEWSIDTIGPFTPDADGNAYILVAVDGFSRFVMLEPAADATGEAAAKFLLKITGIFGRPKSFRHDGGSQFENHLIDTFSELLGVDRHVTLAYRPQANGRVERVCKEIGRHLRYIVLDRRLQDKWSIALPMVQRLLNCTEHIALGVEPAKIVFGGYQTMDRYLIPEANVAKTGVDIQLEGLERIQSKERSLVVKDYIAHLVDAQRAIITAAKDYQASYLKARKSKQNNSVTVTSADYKIGEWVLCGWQGLAVGKTRPTKLHPCWRGPFQIVATDAKRQTVTLRDPTDLKVVSPDVHISLLTKYRMGLTSPDDLIDLRAMDTAEEVVLKIVKHDIHYPVRSETDRKRLLPRRLWRFKAEFVDGTRQWMYWAEANQQAALDAYSREHPELKLPTT